MKGPQQSSSPYEAELSKYQTPIEFQESDKVMLNVPGPSPDLPLDDTPSKSSSATSTSQPAAPSDDTAVTRVIELPDQPTGNDSRHASVDHVNKNQVTDQVAGKTASLQESFPVIIKNLREELEEKRNELNSIVEELAANREILRVKDDLVKEKNMEMKKLKAAINKLVDHIERNCKRGILRRTTFLDNTRQQTYITFLPIGSPETDQVEEDDDSTITMDSSSSLSVIF